MAAPAVPARRTAVGFTGNSVPELAGQPRATRAVAYQRVLHQLMRREWPLLAELAAWADPADRARTRDLTAHAELLSRVLLHHHAVERDRIWPALQRASLEEPTLQAALEDWTGRCARIDHVLRDVVTAARQWAVSGTARARDAFVAICTDLAGSIERQTAEEERTLLPVIDRHLTAAEWRAIHRAAKCPLSAAEQLFVLGLMLEDACSGDRARMVGGLPFPARWAWRATGRGRFHATVVRLRGAPPAA